MILNLNLKIKNKMNESNPSRVHTACATETVDSGSIPGRLKPNTMKISIHSFPA